jgi:nucleotidyltransferase substrate binding protein (TIGR01987 family)
MTQKILDKQSNFKQALTRLEEINEKRPFSDLEQTGMIQRFVFTLELGWRLLEEVLVTEGNFEIKGSRDVVRIASKRGLINNSELWMEMIDKRNKLAHQYNEQSANDTFSRIKKAFISELQSLDTYITKNYKK